MFVLVLVLVLLLPSTYQLVQVKVKTLALFSENNNPKKSLYSRFITNTLNQVKEVHTILQRDA